MYEEEEIKEKEKEIDKMFEDEEIIEKEITEKNKSIQADNYDESKEVSDYIERSIEKTYNKEKDTYIKDTSNINSDKEDAENPNLSSIQVNSIGDYNYYFLFLLQCLIKDNKIHLYVISEPEIMDDSYIRVILNINKRRRLRNMYSVKSIIMKNKKDNNVNRIIDYSANLDNTDIIAGARIIEIERTAVIQNNAIYLDNIISPENIDYLNTNKVQELISKGEIDFS